MAQPQHCLVTERLQSTYFNVLYAYCILVVKYILHPLMSSVDCAISACSSIIYMHNNNNTNKVTSTSSSAITEKPRDAYFAFIK